MRTVIELTAAVVMLAGVGMGIYAFSLPSRYVLDNAIQMSGIYSQATFYGVLSIALFAFAGVLMLSLRPQST